MKKNLTIIFSKDGENGKEIRLEHDSENNLYVNGKKIVTEKKIKLSCFQLGLAVIVAVSSAIQAIVALFSHL